MNSQFFLICFGALAGYATLRTVRHGWLRVLLGFCLAMCLIKVAFDAMFPPPLYVAQQSGPAVSFSGVGYYIGAKINGLEQDRCIMEHLHETPLGTIAYAMQLHQFLNNYRQAQMAGGGGAGTIQKAMSDTFAPAAAGQPEGLCDQFSQWLDSQMQSGITSAVNTVREQGQ